MCIQCKFQDPNMEVLYHIESYFWCISPYIGIIHTRYPQIRYLKWSLHIYIYMQLWYEPQFNICTWYEVCRYTCRYMLPSKAITWGPRWFGVVPMCWKWVSQTFDNGDYQIVILCFKIRYIIIFLWKGVGECPNCSYYPTIEIGIYSPFDSWEWCSKSTKRDIYQLLFGPNRPTQFGCGSNQLWFRMLKPR